MSPATVILSDRTLSAAKRQGVEGSAVAFRGNGEIEPILLIVRQEYEIVIKRDGKWFVAWSPDVPGANGQGRTVEKCRENLGAAIQLIFEDGRGLSIPEIGRN